MKEKVPCRRCGKGTTAKSGVCKNCQQRFRREQAARKCERCPNPVGRAGYRVCRSCEQNVKTELATCGYLTEVAPPKPTRTAEQQEVTKETKLGVDR